MPETILEEAQRLTHGERQASYGHPIDDFSRTAAMWQAILGCPVTAEQVAMCMIAIKLSRLCHTMRRDSVVDVAGYANTMQMIADERERRNADETDIGD